MEATTIETPIATAQNAISNVEDFVEGRLGAYKILATRLAQSPALRAAFLDNTLQLLVDNGLVTQDELDAISDVYNGSVADAIHRIIEALEMTVTKGLPLKSQPDIGNPFKSEQLPASVSVASFATAAAEEDVQVYFNWAGLVVQLSHSATNSLSNGLGIVGGVLGVMAATGVGAPVAAVFSAFFAVSTPIIQSVDQGKGVYLTLTYPQMACLSLAPVPIPTAVV